MGAGVGAAGAKRGGAAAGWGGTSTVKCRTPEYRPVGGPEAGERRLPGPIAATAQLYLPGRSLMPVQVPCAFCAGLPEIHSQYPVAPLTDDQQRRADALSRTRSRGQSRAGGASGGSMTVKGRELAYRPQSPLLSPATRQ
jgi:hypothetical protein